ncbi:CocE/NonD family hydrolase [Thalassotalea castellviae]|uniref:CocE/NonD family hydrolase n=1 Tax=Thalassotalea castellviae TaxID=3075612 RepID=A0ABU3A3J6_9GAMM|nr:CocE/NonD family hydrolase [Thalassotalea sp. W431]MDT0604746.1 CocE/NonD family hydrolase [Thalassotalea sp. W431]
MKKISLTSIAIYSVIILLKFMPNTYAADEQTYPISNIISKADLSSESGQLALLTSDDIKSDLSSFAQSLKEKEINQQSMFSKIALFSLREDVDKISSAIRRQQNTLEYSHYQFFHQTRLALNGQKSTKESFVNKANDLIKSKFEHLNDEGFVQLSLALGWSVSNAKEYVLNIFKQLQKKSLLTRGDMINLAVNYHLYQVLDAIIPIVNDIVQLEQQDRFVIQPDVLVKLKNGIEISTTIVRSRGQTKPNSTALQYTIYADETAHIKAAMHAAAHGYIGIVANSRGKRSSNNDIVPWEHEGEDASQLINWITEQVWSDGNVVMYGGSYNGFTQWATAKHMPKGLKAMAPYVAANLITGLPYENNIALTGNFEWPLYVTNNKTVDNSIYSDWQRTNNIINELYSSGRPFVDIDKIANKPSPWLQKWLAHPEDAPYYQKMVPHQDDYKHINIPVLSITGYFEGGQISALHYMHEHYKYNENANHALLIGPYNHGSAQGKPRSHHSNYELDPVALEKDTEEITFAWFDHILKGKTKPKLVQNKVNYQIMGANEWRFSDSLQVLNQRHLSFYIQTNKPDTAQNYLLAQTPSSHANHYIEQTVDMSDRSEQRNRSQWPVISEQINKQGGIQIETPVFKQDMELTGAISGFFDIAVNKKDVDIGFNFYEVTADGNAFHLNNYRSRASYADDMSTRRLLTPNVKRRVPIVNARFTSKLIEKGSKIVLVLNVNKNVEAQVNLGSGKLVNHETLLDVGKPMKLKWYLSSQINLPLKPWVKEI